MVVSLAKHWPGRASSILLQYLSSNSTPALGWHRPVSLHQTARAKRFPMALKCRGDRHDDVNDSISSNLPALNRIEMISRICSTRRNLVRTGRLHPSVVVGLALNLDWLALPVKRQPEAGQTFVKDGLLECGSPPCSASIDRNIDTCDAAAS